MTLLVPMYHRASAGPFGNSAATLEAHLGLIAQDCHCVLPGQRLRADRLNVCLSFDDATVDFYAVVFPLLRRLRLRALLAVPVGLVSQDSKTSMAQRLRACEARAEDEAAAAVHCNWSEIAEMAASGSVAMAAHGMTHRRLDDDACDLSSEIVGAQALLAQRSASRVESFVFPYGRFSSAALSLARRHYRYVFRIGGADNAGWDAPLLYRFDADEMTSPAALLSARRRLGYRSRRHWNALRGR
ncbi:MAG: polysaccharide deacetylase family protein [Pseudomonadota bacterium]|nr:polysaccharide deacetylase family protein [Pseudomonadota bacterium]